MRQQNTQPKTETPASRKSGQPLCLPQPHRRTVLGLTARSDHPWPSRLFRQPMVPRRISGVCYPHPRTVFRLTARSGHFRQRRHFPLTAEVRTHFGRTAPTGPPSTGHSQPLPAAAIAAAPGKFNAPFPTRRTSPVMTNDRISPLSPWAESRRNGSAIRRPISCGSPRRPARVSVSVRLFAASS